MPALLSQLVVWRGLLPPGDDNSLADPTSKLDTPRHPPPSDAAVYVGLSQLEYAQITLKMRAPISAFYATGAHLSVAAGRISFTFGLRGAAVAVDTACSSGLVAAHLAARALGGPGGAAMAAAGGVNLTLAPSWTLACNRAGMLAADGRCKALDAAADGYVRAEAAGLMILVPAAALAAASAAPLALLAGSAVNQDGRSSSLTAPNGPSQQAAIRAALASAGAAASEVALLDLHGTGTPLGDPIEVGAATAVLLGGGGAKGAAAPAGGGGGRAAPLLMSAAKSQLGHAEPAAGMVGLL
ncbi:MAG: thiolase-like protein, partial [Monoraphidium minutum]